VLRRDRFPLAYETREHLTGKQRERFAALLPGLYERFGSLELLVGNAAKDPHRFGESRVLVRRFDGRLDPMAEASQFIRHLTRIDCFRVYAAPQLREPVAAAIRELWAE
jgi:hypothetical protein